MIVKNALNDCLHEHCGHEQSFGCMAFKQMRHNCCWARVCCETSASLINWYAVLQTLPSCSNTIRYFTRLGIVPSARYITSGWRIRMTCSATIYNTGRRWEFPAAQLQSAVQECVHAACLELLSVAPGTVTSRNESACPTERPTIIVIAINFLLVDDHHHHHHRRSAQRRSQ